MQEGYTGQLGATPVDGGVNFALYSSVASRVELCLFDESGHETRMDLPHCDADTWHGFLPGASAGLRYGYRVHGDYDPDAGARCNPHKLLIDPYAKRLDGEFHWHPSVFDHDKTATIQTASLTDSAPHVPKCIVTADALDPVTAGPRVPWSETIFYELNLRGYTMRHPAVDEAARGTYAGLRTREVLEHIRSLGITSVELMPVQAFVDEHHLARKGLRNYWGYNSIAFFAPMQRYAVNDPVTEFRDMVDTIHAAGLEVILDVVYNHTAESDGNGPTICYRGIDNLAYYRTVHDKPGWYVNDTGTGNTINVDHPQVRRMIIDSLRYWVTVMGVDGFRFDLAPVLGRHAEGFSRDHPLLHAIDADPVLSRAKLVAEPWDPGPGGYQLGQFPSRWGEWNDQFRDTARRFWRGDHGVSGELARRIHGSADIFDVHGRNPACSVNLVTAHDGFTLADLVSFEHRHNEANGEQNRDGHAHNFSCNHGVEGPTDDAKILAARRGHRLNLLATLMFSQGTPLLLAGDEMGQTQGGNNNAYAQDNETAWLDWGLLFEDRDFLVRIKEMIALRAQIPLLRQQRYVHGPVDTGLSRIEILWLNRNGKPMKDQAWADAAAFSVAYLEEPVNGDPAAFAVILINRGSRAVRITLPERLHLRDWEIALVTQGEAVALNAKTVGVPARSVVLVRNARSAGEA